MELLTGAAIRDFRIRGNYFNQRSLAARKALLAGPKAVVPRRARCSPPVVEFELEDGTTSSIVVSDVDVPPLCSDDIEQAKRRLCLIVNAREGDPEAVRALSCAEQEHPLRQSELPQPVESRFVVPSTSSEVHSEQEISQKGFILLKLSQLEYPVPDFTVLTAHVHAEAAQHLEEHVAEAIQQLEILTMQRLGDSKTPLVFAIRCASALYIPGLLDTYLNVGITERTLPGLQKMYGPDGARKMFLNNLRNLCHCLNGHAAIASRVRSDLSPDEVMRLAERLSDLIAQTDRRLLEDPFAQAVFIARQAYKHFEENQELVLTLCRGAEHHPSLIFQKMICTVRHESAYAGVISSRHTKTGVGFELQSVRNIFGEEMMTGTAQIESTVFEDREAITDTFPAVYHFVPQLTELEEEFESPVTIECGVEATP